MSIYGYLTVMHFLFNTYLLPSDQNISLWAPCSFPNPCVHLTLDQQKIINVYEGNVQQYV